jgi:hypothetical protein
MADVITVGAYNKDFHPCDFSNYTGSISNTQNVVNYGSLDIWAPGEQIYVATIDGGYGYVGGTSIAAAIETASLAYQIGDWYTIDVPEELLLYSNLRLNMEMEETSRSGILVLEDQYSNSINRVASMYSNYTDAKSYQTRFLSSISVYLTAGEHSKKWLYYPRYSGTMTVVTPLPAGLSIENGWIIGTATLSGDDAYSVQEYIINHTSADGEYIAEQKFRIVITSPTLTIEDLPEDTNDEIILFVKARYEGNFCTGSPSYGWGYCGTICSGGFYCIDVWYYCGEGKSFSCSCRLLCP